MIPGVITPTKKTVSLQGQRANLTGSQAEGFIYCILKERGYQIERQAEICLSIYGGPVKCDFLVNGVAGFADGLILESKWQSSGGSVDEKYPYLVENIRRRYPYPTIVVYGGSGMRDGAIEWLKNQADGQKLVAVFSFEEFMLWAMNNL